MTEQHLISVIIPTYNCARYLPEALESVLQQSYPHYEIIVVDDGSTDNTQAVLAIYQDKIRCVYQENQGTAAARNAGLRLAQGEFVLFLDHDDYLCRPTMFAEMVALVQTNPQIDVVHSGWYEVDETGQILRVQRPWLDIPQLDIEAWFKWAPSHLHAVIIRRSCAEAVGGFNPSPEVKYAEDIDFFLRLSLAGCRFEWLPQITGGYRLHQSNLSRSDIPLSIDQGMRVRTDLLARPEAPEKVRRQKQQIQYSFLLWGLDRLLAHNCSDEVIAAHLVKILELSPYANNEAIYDLAAQSSKFEYLQRGKSVHAARLAAILAQAYPGPKESELQWWGQVWWWYYLSRQSGTVARQIGPYQAEAAQKLQGYSAAERVRLARLALLHGVNLVYGDGLSPAEVLAKFKQDAKLITARPLYLTYLWRLVKSRHWPAAWQILPKIWQS